MKVISNEASEGLRQCPLTTSESPDKLGPPKSSALLDLQTTPQIPGEMEHFATCSGTPTIALKCQVPRLAKYETEDSAVPLPQGANLPSTHQDSEKNFVLHSRDSSCDSGVLSASSSPAADHIKMLKGKDSIDACHYASELQEPGELCTGHLGTLQISALSLDGDTDCQEEKHPEESSFRGSQGECSQDKINEGEVSPSCFSTLPTEEKSLGDSYRNHSLEELPGQGLPLRKYSTSDSLDEYMDACCRLSKVSASQNSLGNRDMVLLQCVCLSSVEEALGGVTGLPVKVSTLYVLRLRNESISYLSTSGEAQNPIL